MPSRVVAHEFGIWAAALNSDELRRISPRAKNDGATTSTASAVARAHLPADVLPTAQDAMHSSVIPAAAYPALQAAVGMPVVVDHVQTGVGGPGIVVCQGPDGRAVLKRTAAEEVAFYQQWAPVVEAHGLGVPRMLAQGKSSAGPWLILEWLPRVMGRPEPTWTTAQTAYLAQLHRIGLDAAPSAASQLPTRNLQITGQDAEDALALWEPTSARRFRSLLREPWPYAEGQQLVSGDPNPTNWGWRSSGELVLFDWAEVGFGHPAYDLPILCGGLPDGTAVRRVVVLYLSARHIVDPAVVDAWVAWAVTARLVTFLRFLAGWRRGQVHAAARISVTRLRDGLWEWVQAVRPLTRPFAQRALIVPE